MQVRQAHRRGRGAHPVQGGAQQRHPGELVQRLPDALDCADLRVALLARAHLAEGLRIGLRRDAPAQPLGHPGVQRLGQLVKLDRGHQRLDGTLGQHAGQLGHDAARLGVALLEVLGTVELVEEELRGVVIAIRGQEVRVGLRQSLRLPVLERQPVLRQLRIGRERAAQLHDAIQTLGQARLEFAAHRG